MCLCRYQDNEWCCIVFVYSTYEILQLSFHGLYLGKITAKSADSITLVFNMMNEKLKDKVVAIELAGNNILIANNNDNFKNELISLGFEKVEPYYSISIPVDDVEKRAVLFQKLMELGTLFSNGKDWSPSEIVRYYRDKGLIKGDYLRIAWRNKQDFDITTE